MTDDLVKRLRNSAVHSYLGRSVIEEAADRIEDLTAERDHAWAMVADADTRLGQSLADAIRDKADNARLREALEFYADLSLNGPWNLRSEDYGRWARAALNTGKDDT